MATLGWIILVLFLGCLIGRGRRRKWYGMAHWEIQGWLLLILGWVFVPFYAHSKVFRMSRFLFKYYN
jgi:hypothetical protein